MKVKTAIYSLAVVVLLVQVSCKNDKRNLKDIDQQANTKEKVNKIDSSTLRINHKDNRNTLEKYLDTKTNQKDSLGLKQGQWIDTLSHEILVHHYKDDILHGTFMCFLENGELLKIQGTYKNGAKEGPWKFYYKDGSLEAELNVQKNRKGVTVHRDWGNWVPKYRSYIKSYDHKTKKLSKKGYLLYDEDFDGDESVMNGEWLIYDKKGEKIIKKKYFKDARLIKEVKVNN